LPTRYDAATAAAAAAAAAEAEASDLPANCSSGGAATRDQTKDNRANKTHRAGE